MDRRKKHVEELRNAMEPEKLLEVEQVSEKMKIAKIFLNLFLYKI